MTWMVPAALVGLAAVLVPVILHFLGRPTPIEIIFPAIQFLLRKKVAAARIYTLREIIILLLRMAVVATAILIIAGPKVFKPIPTCTEKDIIARDVTLFIDNSSASQYQPPEVSSTGATAFDLYRDLALTIATRVDSDRTISISPVDHYRCSTISKSPYHDQARAVLRAAEAGEVTDISTAFQIAYGMSLDPEFLRSALVAFSMAKLPEVDKKRVLFLQARPLSRMGSPRNYAITNGEFFLGASPFSRNGVAMEVVLPPKSEGARLVLYVDGTPQDAAECAPTGEEMEKRRVNLSFTLPESHDARLEVKLEPPDALPADNIYRAVVNVPPWPKLVDHGAAPGGVIDMALEALTTAAGGHQDENLRVHVLVARDGALPEYATVAEEVTRGAGAVVFLPGKAKEPAGLEGLLPADPMATRPAAPVARGGGFSLDIEGTVVSALTEAGITSGDNRSLIAALAGSTLYPIMPRPGTIQLLAAEREPVVVERPWGRGRIVVVGMDPEAVDSPFRRGPGTFVPFLAEMAFRTVNWRPVTLKGIVGEETTVPTDVRIAERRAELLPPGMDTWQPLYVSRPVATTGLGFVPYKAGWWQARLEDPGAGYRTWTVGINPAKTPDLVPPDQLMTPQQVLDKLSEAETSDLTGPLAVLLLILALAEAAASNHLFRRAAGG